MRANHKKEARERQLNLLQPAFGRGLRLDVLEAQIAAAGLDVGSDDVVKPSHVSDPFRVGLPRWDEVRCY